MNAEPTFTIKQTAEQTGIAEDTIRYYEKINLLPRAKRKDNGHRVYNEKDVQMLQLISCLKKTGMPLEEMRPFLVISTDTAFAEYPDLVERLGQHRENLVKQIASLQQIVDQVDEKLKEGRYKQKISAEPPVDILDTVIHSTDSTSSADVTNPIDQQEKWPSSVQMNYFSTATRAGL